MIIADMSTAVTTALILITFSFQFKAIIRIVNRTGMIFHNKNN